MKNTIKLLLAGLWLITVSIYAIEQPLQQQALSQQQINQTVANTIKALEHDYLFPEKTLLAKKVLRYQLLSGELYPLKTPHALAKRLTALLRQSTGDHYFQLIEHRPPLDLEHSLEKTPSKGTSFGAVSAEFLDGNIGYLKFERYYSLALALQDVKNALCYLSKVDAIIIDLREAERGSLELSQYLMSFFIEPNTKLGDITYRQAKTTEALLSQQHGNYLKFQQHFPLYILNSAFVAGSWEFFSYTLKHFDKAVIIGEPTMGLGYLTKAIKITEDFSISMPYAMTQHPITRSNWQQWGVSPDFEIKAEQAPEMAYSLARQYLDNKSKH